MEHGQVIDVEGFGDPGSIGWAIGQRSQCNATAGKAVVDADDARCGLAIMECDFERVLIGHRSASAEQAVIQACTLRAAQRDESFAHPEGGFVVLQVALHDGVFECGIERGAEHVRVGVPHTVNADADDEVEFDATVSQFDEGAVSKTAADVREEQGRAAGGG